MLSVLFWILCGAGMLCLIVFPGKRKGVPPVSGRDDMITGSACNISAVTLLLTQMIFPLYGNTMNHARDLSMRGGPVDPAWIKESGEVFLKVLKEIPANYRDTDEYFEAFPENSVYMFVILTAVFCFFAGMHIYKNGLKIRHKVFLLIPVPVLIAAVAGSARLKTGNIRIINDLLRYRFIVLEDSIARYLFGAVMMIAVLYGIYLILKKLFKNETAALIVILILSFFAPGIRLIRDGLDRQGPFLRYFLFGPDIPLFPAGMLVMKFKDRILPQTKKGILIHVFVWLILGGISFNALSGLQEFLLNRAGLKISDGYTCFPDEIFYENSAMLEKIYKMECIPWLIFGLALSMLILSLTLLIKTGNPVTKFCRENCYLISVLLFSRHIYGTVSGNRLKFWTDVAGMKAEWLVLVPFIYFALFAVLAYLINRIMRAFPAK